jgi:undecaprenyl-diphosphatase
VNQSRTWIVTACVCAVLAVPLTIAASGPTVLPGDVETMRAAQSWVSPSLDNLARALTVIGSSWPGESLLALACVIVLLSMGLRRPALFVAASALAGTINVVTKRIVASPRPTGDLVQIIQASTGSGFPSGHAFGATLFYGSIWIMLPAVIPDVVTCWLFRGVAILTALGICWSRVRPGAHWPSDVLGGVLWGFTVLSLLAALYVSDGKRDLVHPPMLWGRGISCGGYARRAGSSSVVSQVMA